MSGRFWSGRDAAALALLAALSVAFHAAWLFHGQTLYLYDVSWLIVPEFDWIHRSLAAGHEVAWDQSVLCGSPMFDQNLSACLYPPLRLVLRYWNGWRALGVYQAAHLAWAGWGAYFLARTRGLRPGSALCGGIAATLGGGLVYYECSWVILISLSWFPWMLLGLALVHDGGAFRRAGAGLLGLAVGLSFLGGHPGMSFLGLGALAVLHLGWLAGGRWRDGATWRALIWAALVAVLLYGGQALAVRRAAGMTERGQPLPPEQRAETSLSPSALGEAVLPHALGRRADDSFVGVSWRLGTYEPQGLLVYIGLAGLLLAAAGFAAQPRALAALAVAWLLLLAYALGRWDPAYRWISALPVLDHLRAPNKAMALTACLAALPIATGVESLRGSGRRWPALAAVALALLLLAAALSLQLALPRLLAWGHAHILSSVLGGGILHQRGVGYYDARLGRWASGLRGHLLTQAAWSAAAAGALALLASRRAGALAALALALVLAGDLASNGRANLCYIDESYFSRVPAVVAEIRRRSDGGDPARTFTWGYESAARRAFPAGRMEGDLDGESRLREALKSNLNRLYDLDTSNGYSAVWLSRQQALLGWVDDGNPNEDGADSLRHLARCRKALDLSASRWVASAVPLGLPGLRLVHSGDELLYENTRALPMAYVATRSSGGWTAATAWSALSASHSTQAQWERPALLEDGSAEAPGAGSVRWRTYRDDRWELEVDVVGPSGVLVLSRSYYPGPWKARVDGVETALLPANAAFCALHLGPGRHSVSVAYEDPWLGWARAGVGLGLALALGLGLHALWVARRRVQA